MSLSSRLVRFASARAISASIAVVVAARAAMVAGKSVDWIHRHYALSISGQFHRETRRASSTIENSAGDVVIGKIKHQLVFTTQPSPGRDVVEFNWHFETVVLLCATGLGCVGMKWLRYATFNPS